MREFPYRDKFAENDLKRRQEAHLAAVSNRGNNKPCMHDNCPNCIGTGIGKNGAPCLHGISCPCWKCTPSF